MFWTIVLYIAIFGLGFVLGTSFGIGTGEKGFVKHNYIGVYDVPSANLYYDKDITPNALENEEKSFGVVDLVYLTEARRAK